RDHAPDHTLAAEPRHGERDVPVPGVVAADLVLVEADFGLGGLEALLDGPAGAGDADEVLVGAAGWTGAQVVGQLGILAGVELGGGEDLSADQQPAPTAWWGVVPDRERGPGPVEQPRSLGALAAGPALPGLVWSSCGGVIGPARPHPRRDGLATRHGHDVADPALLAPGAELVVLPVG